jgi:1-acyl-sn-glycerol-3-phosphate acyltransferase
MRWWVWYPVYAGAVTSVTVKFRMRISGARDLPTAPVLLAVKHVSAWDIPVATMVVRRVLQGRKPYVQMGSFIGYPVFSRLVPAMQGCGGFSVLRPKEVLRLRKSPDHDRERIRALMDEVNGTAEATRRAVLASGGVLVLFPEGTRDASAVRPVRSTHEIESALAVAADAGTETPVIVPATFSYGPRALRRTLDVHIAQPIPLLGLGPDAIAARLEAVFREHWRPAPV